MTEFILSCCDDLCREIWRTTTTKDVGSRPAELRKRMSVTLTPEKLRGTLGSDDFDFRTSARAGARGSHHGTVQVFGPRKFLQ